jgi:hypothetical protein
VLEMLDVPGIVYRQYVSCRFDLFAILQVDGNNVPSRTAFVFKLGQRHAFHRGNSPDGTKHLLKKVAVLAPGVNVLHRFAAMKESNLVSVKPGFPQIDDGTFSILMIIYHGENIVIGVPD